MPPCWATLTTCFCETRQSVPSPFSVGGEAHHRIEGLGEDLSRRPRHREFMHRQAGGSLQHPGLLRVLGLRGRLVEKAFPGGRLGGRTQGHAIAAIAAVGLQHELLAMLPRIFQQIALAAMGQGGAPVADDPGPEHMAPEQAALFHAEQPLGDGGIGQQLPAALMVEIAGKGGDHAVLAEQQAHAVERLAQLLLQRQEVANLVIAIGDIDLDIAIEDLLPLDAELARIGMDGDEPMALRQIAAEDASARRVRHGRISDR